MNKDYPKIILNTCISLVWLTNGLFCKVLGFAPRHKEIVSRILGADHAVILTKGIGVLEILMFIWILSRIRSRWCAITQIVVVAIINTIEFFVVPDILLFGKVNALIAALFISIVFFNEFVLNEQSHSGIH